MSSYTVRMIMGSDTCTTITTVDADSAADAAIVAELKWTDIVVKIVNVEDADGCCYLTTDCNNDDHYCSTCDTHLDNDEDCTNCYYN
jgi:hypothetical protein